MFSFDSTKIDWENLIDSGSFGKIYPYKKTPDDDRFVVKYIRVSHNSDLLDYFQEIVLGFSCKHNNVLPVRGYHIEYDQKNKNWEVYIKLDRMECSLKSKMIQHQYEQRKSFSQKEIVNYFYEMSCGLEYLHAQGIAHRDIKPANILISKNEEIKIADIGVGKFVGEETQYVMGTAKGTYPYTAPEILQKKDTSTSHLKKKDLFKADIWSLGVVMAELCLLEFGIVDFRKSGSENESNIMRKLKELQGKYDKVLLDLVGNLLCSDPSKRKSLQDIQKNLTRKYGKDLKSWNQKNLMQHDKKSLANQNLEETSTGNLINFSDNEFAEENQGYLKQNLTNKGTQITAFIPGEFFVERESIKPALETKKTIERNVLTPEEIQMKSKICEGENLWIKKQKEVKDPEETKKKEIKFNLNIITLDNFETIKEKIHELASESENCKKVAELIIENALKQKKYVNIYAKLCDFLGRSEKLYLEDNKSADPKKKKNSFKLHIMKQIQNVFEEEQEYNLTFGMKKTLEEMNDEEKALFFTNKKQIILGNISFIGELFLEKFLFIGLVRIITNALLQRFLDEYVAYQKAPVKPKIRSYEDTLEGLLKFYEIIGKAVEDKESSSTKSLDKAKSSNCVTVFQKALDQANSAGNPSGEAGPKITPNDEVSLEDLFKIFNLMSSKANLTKRLDSLVKNLIYRRDQERKSRVTKEVYFQVAADPKVKQQEETKIDKQSVEVDTNMSFRPCRNRKTAPKKAKVNYEEIEKELKDIYKLSNGEEIEERESPEEETKKLAVKVSGREVLSVFLKTFFDGRLEQVKKRLFIPSLLIKSNFITEEEFLEKFMVSMYRMSELACDYPGSDNNFAVIFLDYCKQVGSSLSPLNKLSFSKEFYESEDCDMILEFYQDFFRQLLKNLEEDEYKNLEISEDDLKAFVKKLKIDDYEDFKSTI